MNKVHFALGLLLAAAPAAAQGPVTVPRFDSVELQGGGQVVLRHGPTQRVTIVRGNVEMTRFSVERGRLEILACVRSCRNYDLQVEIVTPDIGERRRGRRPGARPNRSSAPPQGPGLRRARRQEEDQERNGPCSFGRTFLSAKAATEIQCLGQQDACQFRWPGLERGERRRETSGRPRLFVNGRYCPFANAFIFSRARAWPRRLRSGGGRQDRG